MAAAVRRRWKGGSRSEPPLYEPSIDDLWCAEARRRIGKAIGKYLVESRMLERKVKAITDLEMDGIAQAAMDEYTVARCERYEREEKLEQNPEPHPGALIHDI